jgi:hypothetical protein
MKNLIFVFLIACSPAATNLPSTSIPLGDAAAATVESTCEHLTLPAVGCYPATSAGLASCVAGITNMTQLGFAPNVDFVCASNASSRAIANGCQGISCP